MNRILFSITCALVVFSGADALAHPGHGVARPGSWWHLVLDHAPVVGAAVTAATAVVGAAAVAAGVVIGGRLWQRRSLPSRER